MLKNKAYDVIIVGGGVMGSATAYYLSRMDQTIKLAVVEMDPSYTHASTPLSVANVRIQFNLKENIRISQYAFEALERFEEEMAINGEKPKISWKREGNLFLIDSDQRLEAETAMAMQKDLGCQVQWLPPEEIRKRWPLYNPGAYAGGTLGVLDGTMDAYAVLMGFRAKARSFGVTYIKDEVIKIMTDKNRVTGVKLASGDYLESASVVNCAGAWAAGIAQTAAVTIPVEPVKRQVFVVDTKIKPDRQLPATILASGLYIVSETGGLFMIGKSMEEDPVGIDFGWDKRRFMEILWPELAEFVPAWDTLKLVRGWAGLYAVNTLDSNAILGEWPQLKGFYLANGFSGHGFQQAHAVGRYLSELITGSAPAMDLSAFGPERILANQPLVSNRVV